jgi:transposase-like protein
MLADCGVEADHTTMYRWVQRFAPELEKCLRRHLRPCRGPWHVDETYVRVGGEWRYLYRAVDGIGQTVDFLLSARREKRAARRFFRQAGLSTPALRACGLSEPERAGALRGQLTQRNRRDRCRTNPKQHAGRTAEIPSA